MKKRTLGRTTTTTGTDDVRLCFPSVYEEGKHPPKPFATEKDVARFRASLPDLLVGFLAALPCLVGWFLSFVVWWELRWAPVANS